MDPAEPEPPGRPAGGLGPLDGERQAPAPRRRRAWIAVAVVLALLVVPLVAVLRGQRADRLDREAQDRRRAVAAEVARLRRVQAPQRGAAAALQPEPGAMPADRLRARAALVDAVRAAILRDARARVHTGELEGPIERVACGTIARDPAAVPDDRVLSRRVGRYDCLAVRQDVAREGGAAGGLGYPFVAALDFRRFTYVWCRNTPPQGERGEALAQVRLDRACLAAKGRALGTGYADAPDS